MCRVQYFLACDSYSMFMLNEPQSFSAELSIHQLRYFAAPGSILVP